MCLYIITRHSKFKGLLKKTSNIYFDKSFPILFCIPHVIDYLNSCSANIYQRRVNIVTISRKEYIYTLS